MGPSLSQPISRRVPGSFRDPAGYVFERQQRIFRAISRERHETLSALQECGLLEALMADGSLPGTRFVAASDARALAAEHPGFSSFLEHERIAPISYPYEWSYTMLADAAAHTLDLQIRLLGAGFSLQDASAYNIQFVQGRPTFIDLTSIEQPPRLDVWYALGQFGRMFTYPLLLVRDCGWDLRSYFLGALDGRSCEQVVRSFGPVQRCRPRLLLDLTLPYLLGRRRDRRPGGDGREILDRPNANAAPQLVNLRRLSAKVRRLAAGYRHGGEWSRYTTTCSYDETAERAKKDFIRNHLQALQPRQVLDLGCNTGDYTLLAAASGAQVTAVDADPGAVDVLYQRLRAAPARVTPLVADIANPSPAIGFRNQERSSLVQRVDADCVLALALLHHLVVRGNLSVQAVRDLLYDLTRRHVLLEFVPPSDPMFQRLTRYRQESFCELTLDHCRTVFEQRFSVRQEQPIPGSLRTLWLLQKR